MEHQNSEIAAPTIAHLNSIDLQNEWGQDRTEGATIESIKWS